MSFHPRKKELQRSGLRSHGDCQAAPLPFENRLSFCCSLFLQLLNSVTQISRMLKFKYLGGVLHLVGELDDECLSDIKAYFEKHGRVMTESNVKQAMIPVGAKAIRKRQKI